MKQRRYMMKSGQRKLHGASGRYRNRLATLDNKLVARESSPEMNLPYDSTYNDAFKAGFARGYEDGYRS
ncbi:hypothetical protein ACK8P5_06190 [Paenibacillus sp. EC2-1]|uniref:hypothetical protein n=1 Tax=Paenibacillus sp. EC2-1 TaxID=3388665 RepID=UPI003BEF2779